ncbi:MAG TPA: histidine kinase [Clostridia bacterium]|jgi:LytS/YehU family sensor histidine kinase|nr:histidine kinase [Clostridia bacterium]
MIEFNRSFHLTEVIEIEFLQEIQDRFSEATGQAAIVVDYQGKTLTRHSNYTRFCNELRKDPEMCRICEKSDAHGGIEAVRLQHPYIYRCHMGLVEVIVPIMVNGQYLGGIMTGQVLVEEEALEKLEQIIKPKINIEDNKELSEMYSLVKRVSLQKVQASAMLLFTIANYIAEKGAVNIVKQQLNEKSLKLMEEMKVRADLENLLKETELKLLHSQINPHFIFNTLNTISHQALLEGATKTQEIICVFAELLRSTLRNMGKIFTLREELNYIRNYLFIKEKHLRDRLTIIMDIDEACLNNEIPVFTLQPLVENALIHGIEPKEEGGTLTIKAKQENSFIRLSVIDTGVGMPKDTVDELIRLKSQYYKHIKPKGVGLSNVISRLQHHYGSKFKWNIKSAPDKGTEITLFLPKRQTKVVD